VKFTDLYYPLAIIILGLNAWATMQLLKEFRLFRLRSEAGPKGKDSQTINVNLGTAGLTVPGAGSGTLPEAIVPAIQESTAPANIEQPVKEEPAAAPEPPPMPKPVASFSVTTAGVLAVKCPKCGAENSAYRTECFSCNNPLA